MTVIYIDILIGLNIYITYILLLATEKLTAFESGSLRRGISSFLGGISSLVIFLPEFNYIINSVIKLLIAAILIVADFKFSSFPVFLKRVFVFFTVNNIFAGFMIALWFFFTPPKLVIKNGIVYYHFSALTLILSTLLAYIVIKILLLIINKRVPKERLYSARVSLNGRETILSLFLDTGNTVFSLNGLPVVFCNARSLEEIIPLKTLDLMRNLKATNLKTQLIPINTIGGKSLVMGIKPDYFIINEKNIPCIISPVFEPFNEKTDAIIGEAILKPEGTV